MLNIATWRDPYDSGFSPTKPTNITIEPGLTVLVGCNGAGKTTLLNNIKDVLSDEKIPFSFYNNLSDGGFSSMGSLLSGYGDFECDSIGLGASLWTASEGEAIKINIARRSTAIRQFLESGFFSTRTSRLVRALKEEDESTKPLDNRRVLLFDATDSGMSIDSIIEIKNLFTAILEDSEKIGVETYIIISANEYELCRNEKCFDVNNGVYLEFADYEEYRKFILKSRKAKETRIKKQEVWLKKRAEKEQAAYDKLKSQMDAKISEIQRKAEGRSLTWRERDRIRDCEYKLRDFKNNCRFNINDRK